MKVFFEKGNFEKSLEFSGSGHDLLKLLIVNSEEVLIIRNGVLVSLDEEFENTDSVRLLSVVSGG